MTPQWKALARAVLPTKALRRLHPRRLRDQAQWLLYNAYYRTLFGSQHPLATKLGEHISAWESRQGRRDAPGSMDKWEQEYRSGTWRYLAHLEELSRYSVIAGYIQYLKPAAAVLDIGCGEGILLERLQEKACRLYVGVDISPTAIAQAQQRVDGRSRFIVGAAQTFEPNGDFDAIVFNEVLYVLQDPLAVLTRYEQWLKPDGMFITSNYLKSARAAAVRRQIRERYRAIDEVTLSGERHVWTIDVLTAAPAPA